jgi:ankyrin repeat protein
VDKYKRYLSALAYACEIGDIGVCKFLFRLAGGEREQSVYKDSRGLTPMIYASKNGHLDICKWLYDMAGASRDIEVPDLQGQVKKQLPSPPPLFETETDMVNKYFD